MSDYIERMCPGATVLQHVSSSTDRRAWLLARSLGIGGSDIAKIAGISRWGNALSVYLSKLDPLSEEARSASESAEIGNELEDYVAKKFEARTGEATERVPAILQSKEHPFALASVDRVVMRRLGQPFAAPEPIGVLECKTAGVKTDWGTDDEPKIPDDYALQGQWYLGVTGLEKLWFACLCGGYGGLSVVIREMDRDEALIQNLFAIGADFWRLVESRTPPALDGSDITSDILAKLYPVGTDEQAELLPAADLLAAAYIDARKEADLAEERKQEIANKLKGMLGNAQLALTPGWKIAWSNVETRRLDQDALKKAEPQTWERFAKVSLSRRFTVSARKDKKK